MSQVCKSRRVIQLLLVVAGGGSQSENRERQRCVLPPQTRPMGHYLSNSHHLLWTCHVSNVMCLMFCVHWSRFQCPVSYDLGLEPWHTESLNKNMVMGWDKGTFTEERVVVQYVQTWARIHPCLYLARILKKFEKISGNLKLDFGSISHQGNPIGH